ncbi:MAG: guanylate kinase [Clostridia bacterium]|nr:guanylate kinase [Clostridia bacterium]
MRNVLIVLSGPSGAGKGTIAKKLIERNPDLVLSVSCTTRAPRKGEINGKDYYFTDKAQFKFLIENNGLLEYSEHFENFYGTPREVVENNIKTHDVILEIDVNGGLNVKKNFKDTVLIMIVPPSLEEVKNRLIKRNTESIDKINLRMERISYEMEKSKLYDYTVVNDNLSEAIEKIEQIINQEKIKEN